MGRRVISGLSVTTKGLLRLKARHLLLGQLEDLDQYHLLRLIVLWDKAEVEVVVVQLGVQGLIHLVHLR